MGNNVRRVARKELASFFNSPAAYIFLGAFAAVTLFTFFWVETFFARNTADVRPLFEWMPVLFIFLMGAVTMRMWSEERRLGTFEYLMTLPVETHQLVLGKFLACVALAGVALALTLPLPVTVAFLGPLDWGPVIGGYVAAGFLASAYAAVGLYVSSKTDSQIVSVIVTALACAVLYVLGSDVLTAFVGNRGSEILKLLSTGARFESITRGVLDARDLYYYASLAAVFLVLNAHSLETLRWSRGTRREVHRRWLAATVLLCANFLAANLWLKPVDFLRVDMTQGHLYSISPATRNYLAQLREPLLIRGYFSAKTHPLLAPLVPRLRDLIREYQTAAGGRVRSEFIDPAENPDLEKEAGDKFGIKPVPFQVADKYQASVVNSYFNILVQYGDKHEVLGFDDLIEVKQGSETEIDVDLRNPEYDITRTIKKVLQGYQAGDLFATLQKPVVFRGYVSPDRELPKSLVDFRAKVLEALEALKKEAGEKLTVVFKDPREGDASLAREIAEKYGFQPMRANLLDAQTFYFYMVLESGNRAALVPLPRDLSEGGFRQSLEAGLKRFSTGFLKTVALVAPSDAGADPAAPPGQGNVRDFNLLRKKLSENQSVVSVDLKDGRVPDEADLLFLAAPKELDEKQVFALDQYLMKGGSVVLLTSPFGAVSDLAGLRGFYHLSGLPDWLAHHGLTLDEEMVLDPQNTFFPIPVERQVGPFTMQEIKMVNYPYFVDVRGDGLAGKAMTAGLSQVTLHWASPLQIDKEKNKDRTVTEILRSSPKSWTSGSIRVVPDFQLNGDLGFSPGGNRGSHLLAAAVEGRFESFFKGKKSPLLPEGKTGEMNAAPPTGEVYAGVLEKSAESARLILVASNEFLTDRILRFSSQAGGTAYLNSLQLAENMVDWSLEDRGLLSIRSRGQFARLLKPMGTQARMFWEHINYSLAVGGLFGLWLWARIRRRRYLARIPLLLAEGRA